MISEGRPAGRRARPPLAPDQSDGLADAFWRVAGQLRRTTKETLAPLDITPAQARAVGVLSRHGTMRLSDLAQHLRITPRSTTEVVDALEDAGLLARSPDPDDRRATLVSLTGPGTALAASIQQARATEAERFFGTLSPSDRADLTRILRKLGGTIP